MHHFLKLLNLQRALLSVFFAFGLLTGYMVVKPEPDWITLEQIAGEEYQADWSDALEKAVKIANEQHGNTIKIQCGKTYDITRPVILEYTTSVKILGCATDYEKQHRPPSIRYTAGGTESGFVLKSSYGLRFEQVKLEYTNPDFRGYLVDLSHTDQRAGGTGGDSAYNTISDSTFMGTAEANQAAALMFLGGGIISRITDNHFIHARAGIKGVEPHSPMGNHYAYVWNVSGNSFNYVDTAILNPSSNWVINNNTFEPNKEGKLRAIDNDCGDRCVFASGVTFSNNYLGDGSAQQEPIVRFVRASGLNITGNWWYADTETSRAAITLDGCEGVMISGNHAQPFETFIETVGKTSFGLTTISNKINAARILTETASCNGCNTIEPSAAGTAPRMSRISALQASGYAAEGESPYDLSFGFKANTQHFRNGGVYSVMDNAYGLQNGTLLMMSANNYDAPVCWGSDNKPRLCINGQALTSYVPLELPNSNWKYNEGAWKNSNEVVTKKAVYQAFKNHLREVEELIRNAQTKTVESKAIESNQK
ncbi:MAG: hypothetical protein M3209_00105 [Acidobacteriota bacterium]|nr:hypothetical protein [Acidobacteriota bacterium]